MTPIQLLHQALDLYNAGRLEEAFDLVDRNQRDIGGNRALLFNLQYCIASRLGKYDLALQIFRDSVIDLDYWFGYDYLFQDDDLKDIRDSSEFMELAMICKERESRAKKETKAELKIALPEEGGHDRTWIMALHGNGDGLEMTEGNWLPLTEFGHLVALPQSSQIQSYGAYTWQDLEKGLAELRSHLAVVEGRYDLSANELVLAGFSGGARLALHAILHGGLRPKGLILVAPWLPELNDWKDNILALREQDIKVCIMNGSEDAISLNTGKDLEVILRESGVGTVLQTVPGLGHDFPEDFPSRVVEMIGFINKI